MDSMTKRKSFEDNDNKHPPKKNKPLAEFIPASFFKGRLPCAIALTLYDIEKKHPFMCSLNLKSASFSPMLIYSIMQYHKITELKYENICLYGFMFIEAGVTHPSVICNEKICCEAISECEKQHFIPFEKTSENEKANDNQSVSNSNYENDKFYKKEDKSTDPDIKKEEIPEGSPSISLKKYDNILKKSDNISIKICKENETEEKEIIISNTFIMCYFLRKIIDAMNEQHIQIKAEPYNITGYKEADIFSVMLNNMLTQVMCGR